MKKFFAMALALLLFASFAACGTKPSTSPATQSTSATTTSVSSVSVAPIGTVSEVKPSMPTIESTVLLEKDGIKITAQEIVEERYYGIVLKVLVENSTSEDMRVSTESIAVNNYMVPNSLYCSVAAGKKSNEIIVLVSDSVEFMGITSISDINIKFAVREEDDYDSTYITDEILIKTSDYGLVKQPDMSSGKELFNQYGIRIIAKSISQDSDGDLSIVLFIDNTNPSNILVSCDDFSINGFMLSPSVYCTVNSGRMAITEITVYGDDLKENGITQAEDFELKFEIDNPDNYRETFATTPITFTAAELQ